VIGIYDYPTLIDGGFVSAPRIAFDTPERRRTWALPRTSR
jgi:hypothetical protein